MVDRNVVIVDRSPQAADPKRHRILDHLLRRRKPVKHTKYTIFGSVVYGFVQRSRCRNGKLEIVETMFQVVRCFTFVSSYFGYHPTWPYHSDRRPRIIGNERILQSKTLAVSNGV